MTQDVNITSKTERVLRAACVGEANVGKSTLLNSVIESNLSLVTHKAQTTRTLFRGILSQDGVQLVMIDTPGLFKASSATERTMVNCIWHAVNEADIVLLVFDARRGITDIFRNMLWARRETIKSPVAVVINKIDMVDRTSLLPLMRDINNETAIDQIFLVSALKKYGISDMRSWLMDKAVKRTWLYDSEQMSDDSVKKIAAEFTRGQVMLNIHEEIPYSVHVITDQWNETKNRVLIHQSVLVSKKSHKGILIGKQARTIRRIRIVAEQEIGKLLDKTVNLCLYVRVNEQLTLHETMNEI